MVTDVDIAGLGMTPMSLRPGATPGRLACDAIVAALRDASIGHADVDGLLVASSQGVRPERVGVGLAATAGLVDLRLLEHLEIKGATTLAMLQRAHYAISSGEAHTVVCVFADAPIVTGRGSGSTYAHSGGHRGTRAWSGPRDCLARCRPTRCWPSAGSTSWVGLRWICARSPSQHAAGQPTIPTPWITVPWMLTVITPPR